MSVKIVSDNLGRGVGSPIFLKGLKILPQFNSMKFKTVIFKNNIIFGGDGIKNGKMSRNI